MGTVLPLQPISLASHSGLETHWTSLPGELMLPSTHSPQEPSLQTQAWHGPPPQACPVLPKQRQRPRCMLQSASFFPITVYVCSLAVRSAESGDRVSQFALRRVLNTCFGICASLIQTTDRQQTRNGVWTTVWAALARGVLVTVVCKRAGGQTGWRRGYFKNTCQAWTWVGELQIRERWHRCAREHREICYCKGSRMGTQWHSW